MDNNITPSPPTVTSSNVLDIVRRLREDAARRELLLEQVLAFLQQSELSQQDPMCEASSPISAWSPTWESGGVIELSRLTPKVRQIKKPQGKSHDIVTRLKSSGLGKFYASHLKQYPLVRWLAIWIWRIAYPLYVNHISIYLCNRNVKRWRQLIKLGEYVKTRGIPTIKVADAALVETPVPKVFPAHDQEYLASPHDSYNFPQIYVATVSDGMIYGGTNLVLTKDEVICHDLYDFERDYTSEELWGRTLIDPRKGRIRWLLHDEAPERLPAAAAFVDACAPNYAHWLTEVLPRIAAFCASEQFKGIPIVVDDGLHQNIMESLLLVAGADREIITLSTGRALAVGELYLTSVAGYVPFERRTNKLSGHSHGVFSPRAFELIRNQITSFAEKLPEHAWPEKIYLRRNSGARKVTNAEELEELLVAQGYVIVEPEKLTFLQQTQLFSHAKVIVGSSGAALANILFAPPNVKAFILISKYPDTSYWYWQNIACASSKTVCYVFGEVTGGVSGIHADFTVDLEGVLQEFGEEL